MLLMTLSVGIFIGYFVMPKFVDFIVFLWELYEERE